MSHACLSIFCGSPDPPSACRCCGFQSSHSLWILPNISSEVDVRDWVSLLVTSRNPSWIALSSVTEKEQSSLLRTNDHVTAKEHIPNHRFTIIKSHILNKTTQTAKTSMIQSFQDSRQQSPSPDSYSAWIGPMQKTLLARELPFTLVYNTIQELVLLNVHKLTHPCDKDTSQLNPWPFSLLYPSGSY